MTAAQVITWVDGCAGRIRLNRPEALNALSHAMVLAIDAALERWRDDDAIRLVILDAEGERAFCAGGDVAAIWRAAQHGHPEDGRQFWRDEYRLNLKLAGYPKPMVAFLHGIIMGGGLGLGCHLRHRVVCENSRLSPPEARIGMIPDTGATLLLRRAPGELGAWLGVTGASLTPGDAIHARLADHYIPQAAWAGLIRNLCNTGDTRLINRAAQLPPEAPLARLVPQITRAFASLDLVQIRLALARDTGNWARETEAHIAANSPVSMQATLDLLARLTPATPLHKALAAEYRYTFRAVAPQPTDFIEGVRAQLIGKDRRPRWNLHDIAARTKAALAPLCGDELDLT
jgi:enoyl-CoA hydratase/carnithine racemase